MKRVEGKLGMNPFIVVLIVLIGLASMYKVEHALSELTMQLPILFLVALVFIGNYYFSVTATPIRKKKLKYKAMQVKIALFVLSLSAVSVDQMITRLGIPIESIRWWIAFWTVIAGEALFDMLADRDDDGPGFAGTMKRHPKDPIEPVANGQKTRNKTTSRQNRMPASRKPTLTGRHNRRKLK
ncbi:hypothetical protein VF12_40205 [Nostoc linckia z15]|nr:hypothetical protein VF12_40205 [Nostoc linckia z15]